MSELSEEIDMGKLQQNVRDHLEVVFFNHNRALLKYEMEDNVLKKKLENSEAQKKQVMEMVEKNEFEKERNEKNEAQKKKVMHMLQHSESQVKLLKNKLEKKETQNKELMQMFEHGEARIKALKNSLEQSEAQKTGLMNMVEYGEAQMKELQNKLEQAQYKEELLKQMDDKAAIEKKRADEKMLEQKKENEELRLRIIELERAQVKDVKQEQMDEDGHEHVDMNEVLENLKEKEEELADFEALNNTLIVKACRSNDELQEARKELISLCMEKEWESTSHAVVGMKRMGELDNKPFQTACQRKYPKGKANGQAAALCSQWEDYLRDSRWYPFTNSKDHFGVWKETINEEDEKLKILKDDFGGEVYNAVITALVELNEYNRSGRYPVPELWNFKEGRRASLKEGILYLLKQFQLQKRRRKGEEE